MNNQNVSPLYPLSAAEGGQSNFLLSSYIHRRSMKGLRTRGKAIRKGCTSNRYLKTPSSPSSADCRPEGGRDYQRR